MDRSEVEKVSKALADETRLRIFEDISAATRINCGEIVSKRGLTPATVSHHPKVLSEAKLIVSQREGQFVYNNTEGYVQDNWKVNHKLTLDYGVRLVHQQPQYDVLGQASNFLPEKWNASQAPVLYVAGCAAQPCTVASIL